MKQEECCLHFYTLISLPCFQHRRLLIPNTFITNVGHKLSSPALLKLPSNKEWHVELKEYEGQVWFQGGGWHEFMEYHSICVGHLLVFRFDGNLRFHVFIFDTTASEIGYPCPTLDLDRLTNEAGPQTSVKQEIPEEGSLEILVDDDRTTRVFQRSHFSSRSVATKSADTASSSDFVSNKKRKTISDQSTNPRCFVRNKKNNSDTGKEKSGINVDGNKVGLVFGNNVTDDYRNNGSNTTRLVTIKRASHCNNLGTETGLASGLLEKHRTSPCSKSGKFTSFSERERAVRAARAFTSVNPFCTVTMKPSHVHEHFVLNLPVGFTRAYLKKDMQSVNLRVSDGRVWRVRCSTKANKFRLRTGWKEFVLDNYLEEYDMCAFELDDGERRELKVAIFRVQDPKHRKKVSAQSQKPSCLLGNKGMQNEDIGKTLDLSDSEKHENEEVPFRVDKKDKVDLCDTVEPITSTDPNRSSNRIEEESLSLIKVSAYKRLVPKQEKDREMVETTALTSDKPFCIVTMQSSYVCGSFTLNFPTAFAMKYLKNTCQGVNLRISNEATWHADFISGDYCKVEKGWKEFVLDNNIKEGDVCLFELVDTNHMELKVSIDHVQHSRQEGSEVLIYDFHGVADGGLLDSDSAYYKENVFAPPGNSLVKPNLEDLDQSRKIESPQESSSLVLDRGKQSDGSSAAPYTIVEVDSHCTKQETRKQKLSLLRLKQAQNGSIPTRSKSLQDKERVTVAARRFTSKNPFCTVTMRPTYIHAFKLTLPHSFSEMYLKKGIQNVTIRVSDGRRWPIRYSFGKYNPQLYKGWMEFVLDNQLEEGDICIFELVDRYHIELQVTIFRYLHLPCPKEKEDKDAGKKRK